MTKNINQSVRLKSNENYGIIGIEWQVRDNLEQQQQQQNRKKTIIYRQNNVPNFQNSIRISVYIEGKIIK